MVLRGLELLGGSKDISMQVKMIPHTYMYVCTYIYIHTYICMYSYICLIESWCLFQSFLPSGQSALHSWRLQSRAVENIPRPHCDLTGKKKEKRTGGSIPKFSQHDITPINRFSIMWLLSPWSFPSHCYTQVFHHIISWLIAIPAIPIDLDMSWPIHRLGRSSSGFLIAHCFAWYCPPKELSATRGTMTGAEDWIWEYNMIW